MLVAKGLFEQVQVSFIIVGQTHDDIDVSIGRWSRKLHENDYPTMPLLMKSFMDLDTTSVIPSLIEEVLDFKAFIQNCINEDDLMGHTKDRSFLFYRQEDGYSLMKYKLRCTDPSWLPTQGIKLWAENLNGTTKILNRCPLLVQRQSMRGHDDIVKEISGCIDYWIGIANVDLFGAYGQQNAHLIE